MESALDPRARPSPQVGPLVRLLAAHRVEWVLSGSAVLALHGAAIAPNDLDVVPALDPANLRRLAAALVEIRAVPAFVPEWTGAPTLEECREWTPEPPDATRLDHLFVTRLGMLDVPPVITGTFADLAPGASPLLLAGVPVRVCAPEEVLRRLPDPPRAKDVERAEQYAVVRRALRAGTAPRAELLLGVGAGSWRRIGDSNP